MPQNKTWSPRERDRERDRGLPIPSFLAQLCFNHIYRTIARTDPYLQLPCALHQLEVGPSWRWQLLQRTRAPSTYHDIGWVVWLLPARVRVQLCWGTCCSRFLRFYICKLFQCYLAHNFVFLIGDVLVCSCSLNFNACVKWNLINSMSDLLVLNPTLLDVFYSRTCWRLQYGHQQCKMNFVCLFLVIRQWNCSSSIGCGTHGGSQSWWSKPKKFWLQGQVDCGGQQRIQRVVLHQHDFKRHPVDERCKIDKNSRIKVTLQVFSPLCA